MRVLMIVECPHEPFNTLVRKGTAGEIIAKILDTIKPEAVCFTELHGRRTCVLTVNLENASQIPTLAEPWFLNFQADCHIHPAMTPDDLKLRRLGGAGKEMGMTIKLLATQR